MWMKKKTPYYIWKTWIKSVFIYMFTQLISLDNIGNYRIYYSKQPHTVWKVFYWFLLRFGFNYCFLFSVFPSVIKSIFRVDDIEPYAETCILIVRLTGRVFRLGSLRASVVRAWLGTVKVAQSQYVYGYIPKIMHINFVAIIYWL
jgi:hypothetical protein